MYLFHALIREKVLKVFLLGIRSCVPGQIWCFGFFANKTKYDCPVQCSARDSEFNTEWIQGYTFFGGEGFKLIKKSAHNTVMDLLHPNICILINLPSLIGRTCLVHCSRSSMSLPRYWKFSPVCQDDHWKLLTPSTYQGDEKKVT